MGRLSNKAKSMFLMGILLMSIIFVSGCIETGEGSAQDKVYQMQKDGLIWKTYDMYLTNDHPSGDYSAIYCVPKGNTALVEQIEEAVISQRSCKINYHNELAYMPWDCDMSAVAVIDKIDCDERTEK